MTPSEGSQLMTLTVYSLPTSIGVWRLAMSPEP